MASGDVYKAVPQYQVGGVDDPDVNVLYYAYQSGQVEPTPSGDLALALYEDVLPAVMDCISDAIQVSTIQVRGWTHPTEGGDFTFTPAVVGGRTGQTYALQIAQLISWSTGLIGRHYRGRTYLPPCTETDVDGAGALTAGQIARIDAAALAMVTVAATGSHGAWSLVIHSEANPDSDPPWAGANTLVTSWAIRERVKTQRRRGI